MAEKNAAVDAEYDLVVIGSGGSGKSAALTAAKGGLRVAVLEKMKETGGSSVYAEGMAAFESSEQKARKVPKEPGKHFPTRGEGYLRYIDYSHHRADPDVVRMQVENTAETIDIMKSLGVVFTDVNIYAYHQPNELYTFHRPDGLGERVQELLLRACVNAGVDIFTSTPAERLVMRGGTVVGVVARDAKGGPLRIACRAVILATGGFGDNRELMRKYSWLGDNTLHTYQCVPTENTGDGLLMALEAGAATKNIGTLMIVLCARGKTLSSHESGAGSQPVLWVNKKGLRFANEEVAMRFADSGNTVAQQPGATMYAVIDSATLKHLMEEGSDIGQGDFIPYHMKLSRLQAELEEDIPAGRAWKADGIEELGRKIGLDPAVFARTVAEYNAACDKGVDNRFFKSSEFMRPIRSMPVYAIDMAASVLVSDGGIRVNGEMQVLDRNEKTIPGLYAVGNEASGLFGDTYNLDVPGTANAFAHASGRVAGRHVLKTLKG